MQQANKYLSGSTVQVLKGVHENGFLKCDSAGQKLATVWYFQNAEYVTDSLYYIFDMLITIVLGLLADEKLFVTVQQTTVIWYFFKKDT